MKRTAKNLTHSEKAQVYAALASGASNQAVASQFNLALSSIPAFKAQTSRPWVHIPKLAVHKASPIVQITNNYVTPTAPAAAPRGSIFDYLK